MIEDVIVQAGGKGSRMRKFTYNRPKCLISAGGINLLQSIMTGFPNARLHVIGDYRYDALKRYLESVDIGLDYTLTKTNGEGSNGGIRDAMKHIQKNGPVAISWSDLYFARAVSFPTDKENYIVLTNSNLCRYKYDKERIVEESTSVNGIIGVFVFANKEVLKDVPPNGEFVRYLSEAKLKMNPLVDDSITELGTEERLEDFIKKSLNSRFFNKLKIIGNHVVKETRDARYSERLTDEVNWYKYMTEHGYVAIPRITKFDPLTMQLIKGFHPFQLKSYDLSRRSNIIEKIISELDEMHNLTKVDRSLDAMRDVYINKTLERIVSVTRLLNLDRMSKIRLNGRNLEPLLPSDLEVLEKIFSRLNGARYFCPIHGDPTFSNILITDDDQVKFIDPRGYFGRVKIFGDPRYDIAKLYYSAIGNYDQLNWQNFILRIDNGDITLKLGSSHFESTSEIFEEKLGREFDVIQILHSLIWISLSGYLLNDHDAMIAAYLHGLSLFHDFAEV